MGRRKPYKAPAGLVLVRGYWYIVWKGIYASSKTKDLGEAELILRQVQAEIKQKELAQGSRAKEILGQSILFSKLMERYLKEISPSKRSWKSDHVNSKPLLEFFKDWKIDGITAQDVYKFQDWRKTRVSEQKKKAVSGATINREVSLLSDALTKAIRWGYIQTNVCKEIERFSESRRERYITDSEFAAIKKIALSGNKSSHLADIMDCLYLTAQREGRILGLKWSQINFEERSISFEQTSKNKKVPDVIWVNDWLFGILNRLKKQRSLFKVASTHVFRKLDGTPYRSLKTVWQTCCEKAKIQDARINDIRHKAITDMLNAGVPVSKVKTAVGHSQTQTTDGYTHLKVEATREPLSALSVKNS
jgi:integrase